MSWAGPFLGYYGRSVNSMGISRSSLSYSSSGGFSTSVRVPKYASAFTRLSPPPPMVHDIALRVQVPNNHILTPNLY